MDLVFFLDPPRGHNEAQEGIPKPLGSIGVFNLVGAFQFCFCEEARVPFSVSFPVSPRLGPALHGEWNSFPIRANPERYLQRGERVGQPEEPTGGEKGKKEQ